MHAGIEGAWTVPWPGMAARLGDRALCCGIAGRSVLGRERRACGRARAGLSGSCLALSDFDWDVLSWGGEVSVPPTVPSVDSAC